MASEAKEKRELYCPCCDKPREMVLNYHTYSKVFESDYFLYQCTICLTLATWPQLTDEQVNDYYRNEETIGADLYSKWKKKYRYQYSFVKRNCTPLPKTVLEVGSNTGNMLRYFKECGHDVTGLELSHKAAEYARDHNGVSTVESTLEDYQSSTEYDLIVGIHTFEHLKEPRRFLKECRKKLADNGFILIEVPNGLKKSHELLGNSANMLSVPFHFYLYNPHSLRGLLESEGFKHISTRPYSAKEDNGPISRALVQYWKNKIGESISNRILQIFFTKIIKYIIRFYPIRKTIGWWYGNTGKSETFSIIAQKIPPNLIFVSQKR